MTSWIREIKFKATATKPFTFFGSEAEFISRQLDLECAKVTGDGEICISTSRTREYTVDVFNRTNYFHRILTRFVHEDGSEVGSDWSDKWALLFGACAMQLGVAISDKDRGLLRSAFHRLSIDEEPRKRLEKALQEYTNNGNMWDFYRNEQSQQSGVPLLSHCPSMLTTTKLSTCP